MFLLKNIHKWAKLFKEAQNSIQDEDRPVMPIMTGAPEMVDSVNEIILVDGTVTIEDISEQLEISVGTAHKIRHDDLVFLKVSCCWIPQMLIPEHTTSYCSKNNRNYVSFIGNTCHILLAVQIWPSLISTCLALPKNGGKFSSNDEVKSTLSKRQKSQSKDFYAEGKQKLVFWIGKCVLKRGDFMGKLSKKFLLV